MPVDWNNIDTWQRLITAMDAAGPKPNLKDVATYFGTTYDTLENRMRKIRKDADKLKGEDNGNSDEWKAKASDTPAKASASTPRKSKATKSALNTVATGRVTKSKPSKKTSLKQEVNEDDARDAAIDSAGMEEDNETDKGLYETLLGKGEYLFE